MNIAIVSPYTPPEKGAAVTRVMSFANYFQTHGNEVDIITPQREWLHDGVRDTRVIPYRGKIDLVKLFWKKKYDVVLATTPPATVTFDSLVASKINRIPLIVDIRDPWSYAECKLGYLSTSSMSYKRHLLFEKISYKYADKLFVVSPTLKNLIKSLFKIKDEQFSIVPNGVDCDFFYKDIREGKKFRDRLGIKRSSPVITYVGLLGAEKELDKFLECCGYGIVSTFDAHLVFVVLLDRYSETQAKNLEEITCELGIESNFHMLGPVESKDVHKCLSAGDIGLNPLSDVMDYCFPVKTLEYLSCELPLACKAPTNGSLHNFLQEYDVGFFSNSWSEFRDKLYFALEDLDNFKKKGTQGRLIVERYFTREKANDVALKEIQRLLGL